MCGKPNSADAETCKFCSARLKPLQSGSVPTSDKTSGSEPDFPDWLQDLRGSGQTQSGDALSDGKGEAQPAAQSQAESGDDVPDWLTRIRERAQSEDSPNPLEGDDLPSWLTELGNSAQTLKPTESGEESGRLSELTQPASENTPGAGTQLPGELPTPNPDAALPADSALPDWLSSLGEIPASKADVPQPPAPAEPPAPAPTTPKPAKAGRTGLLARLDETPAGKAAAAQPPAPVPPAAAQPDTGAPRAPALPGWLADLGETPVNEAAASQPETELPFDANLPGGLATLGETSTNEEAAAQPPAPIEQAAQQPEAGAPFDSNLPDWLSNLEETPADQTAATLPPVPVEPPQSQPETRKRGKTGRTGLLTRLEETQAPAQSPTPVEPPVVQPESEPAALSDAALPGWLAELEGTPSGQEGAAQAPASVKVPPITPETEPAAPAGEALPDWLAALENFPVDQTAETQAFPQPETPAQAAQPQAAAPVGAAPAEALPSWLADMAEITPESSAPQPPPPAEVPAATPSTQVEMPPESESLEWLFGPSEPVIAESGAGLEATQAEAPGTGAASDWLSQIEPAGQPPAAESADLPDWLKAMRPAEIPSAEPGQPPAEEGAMPEWLVGLQAQQPSASWESAPLAEEPVTPTEPGSVKPFISDQLPDWMSRVEAATPEPPAAPQPVEFAEKKGEEAALEPAELPGWVQAMRPIETVTPIPVEVDERQEKVGPLSGLRGILPAQAFPAEIRKPPIYTSRLQATDKQRLNAALFDSLLANEVKPQAVSKENPRLGKNLLNIVVAILLIVAVWLPLWLGSQQMNLPGYTQPEAAVLQADINALPPNATVLVAVDYEPAMVGEMEAVSTGVMAHLMSKSVNLVLISTNPTGQVLGDQLLMHTLANDPALTYPITEKVVNLGYLAGGTAVLYNFALYPQVAAPVTADLQNAWEQPILRGLNQGDNPLNNLSQIIVITSDIDTARAWIEQVKPTLPRVPLYVLTSAQAAPMLGPYIDSGQVKGAVAGTTGGSLYERNSQRPSIGRTYWDSYQAGIVLVVVLILLGGLVNIVDDLLIRRKRPKGT
jgi:hypothetical protein